MSDQKDDLQAFLAEMKGVKPLKTKTRVVLNNHTGSAQSPGQQQRRRDAQTDKSVDQHGLSIEHLELVHPLDVIGYKRPGLAHGVFRRLRQGRYPVEARLDLHHQTVEQARRQVIRFIQDCLRYDARCAIILHGKGEKGDPPALLKSYTNRWLREIPEVLAFNSAQRHHGGVGAVYVLIKKSEAKKQENREKYRSQT
ncbi:DNA endonuclease SmrA [Gynuella sp.]|uniref:DNA endonuclease SmrA n=1 Tax=Gynuella sp. TaxID=2969146 RepID=UPI003D0A2458